MKIFLVILTVLVCILAFVLFVGINIIFEAQYKEKDFKLKLRVYILNRILGKDFDIFKKEKTSDENKEPKEEKTEDTSDENGEEKAKKSIKEFFDELKKKIKKYLNYKDAFLLSRKKIRKKFVFKSLNLTVNYGDGDAHTTAVAAGTMWGFIYNILAFLTKTATVKKHKENVNALFGEKNFSVTVNGIFKTRLVHIIYAVMVFMINYRRLSKTQNKSNEK